MVLNPTETGIIQSAPLKIARTPKRQALFGKKWLSWLAFVWPWTREGSARYIGRVWMLSEFMYTDTSLHKDMAWSGCLNIYSPGLCIP